MFHHLEDIRIRASYLNSKEYESWSAVGSIVAIAGFVLQFIGLGALHYSATVAVLGFSLLMTIIRVRIRRGLAKDPVCLPILEKNALTWVALRIARNDWKTFILKEKDNNPPDLLWDCE